MKKIFFALLLLPLVTLSQVVDNFSDGDFTNNPTWTGETTEFIVNTAFQLQLTATIPFSGPSDTAYLSTPNSKIDETEWQFWVKISFATSANNHGRVYLVSDQSNLEGPLNGYFVQLGDYGDGKDSISLYKQSGNVFTKIIRGTIIYTNNTTNIFRVKVIRDNLGNWQLFSDATGGNNFSLEGNCSDNTFTNSNFFGIFCKYTSSNSTKIYFDDFYVGPIIVDLTPPTISSISVVSTNQIDVLFSEIVETTTAQNINNYIANNGIGSPLLALKDATNEALVHLTFQNSFVNGQLNSLTISNIKDIAENTMLSVSRDFVYYFVKQHDIVINEIMADPDPVVGLPAYEYIELYNKTLFPISLKGFKLIFGTYTKVFPDSASIEPNGYLIVTKNNAVQLFTQYGKVLGLFSNIYSLTNDGQTIILKDPSNNIISFVSYNIDWYHDSSKKDGGWSMEQIDPLNPCGEINNWKASTNAKGGTPGNKNSVFANNPDNTAPSIVRVGIINDSIIQVYFNESLDSLKLKNLSNYSINNDLTPVSVTLNSPEYKSIILTLNTYIQPSVIYTITITDTIADCVGNLIPINSTARFALPEDAFINDIAINEVLYNPKDDGVDFIELYNRSNKIINLKTLNLSSFKNNVLSEIKPISSDGYLMFPGDYTVVTTDIAKVKSQYYTSNPNGFNEMTSFPSFNNDSGSVAISKKNGDIIDLVRYNDGMQFPLLNSTDGVSLERINYDRPASDLTNWNSASESVGFATPAYKNSQYSNGEQIESPITVEPEIFSPDNDGFNDAVNINYTFTTSGYLANVTIYDANGRLIKILVKNELIGTIGTFSWNGINEDNEKAKIGIYIVYFEVLDLNGSVKHYKKTCVLGAKL